jgi:hypothetical protein
MAILQGCDWPNAALMMTASLLRAMDQLQLDGALALNRSRKVQETSETLMKQFREASESIMEQFQTAKAETVQLTSDLRAAAGDSALISTADYYRMEAERHQSTSMRFLWAVAVTALLLVAGTAVFLIIVPPVVGRSLSATTQVIDFVRGALGRLTILSALGFAVGFCVRNYRINKHLETVNKSRYNALMTAQRFMMSVDDQVRPIVAAELVKAIFVSGSSGYLDSMGETTIIESPSAVLAAVSKAAK